MGPELEAFELEFAAYHGSGTQTVGLSSGTDALRIGLLLFQDILRWMDGEAYDRLDLGYGDYRFKRELSNTQLTLLHGFVGQPSAATLVREAAYGVRRVAEALPLGRASELPGKAMRRLDVMRGLR